MTVGNDLSAHMEAAKIPKEAWDISAVIRLGCSTKSIFTRCPLQAETSLIFAGVMHLNTREKKGAKYSTIHLHNYPTAKHAGRGKMEEASIINTGR
ncbi:hypothetical protein Dimus_036615 [Dionaea muscipula]